MLKIFGSGSCRLFRSLFKIKNSEIIHGIEYHYNTPTSLGYLHDTQSHIQFLRFLLGDIDIPKDIMTLFLSVYSPIHFPPFEMYRNEEKITKIKDNFKECNIYIFEICSIKIYEQISNINNKKYITHYYNYSGETPKPSYIQTKEDLLKDLNTIIELCPKNSIIIFQCHIRPQIIYKDDSKIIKNRELIYETLQEFVNNKKNIYLMDPSLYDPDKCLYKVLDNNYFTLKGIDELSKLYSNILSK